MARSEIQTLPSAAFVTQPVSSGRAQHIGAWIDWYAPQQLQESWPLVNNKVDAAIRIAFRDWLRAELRRLDFYQLRTNHYLIREFSRYCRERQDAINQELRRAGGTEGTPVHLAIDEASLGRYLRDDDPVLPTPACLLAPARCHRRLSLTITDYH